jgi:hypothetical protein
MANGLADMVKNAALAGDVAAIEQLVATHGGAAVRLDGDPAELTALHGLINYRGERPADTARRTSQLDAAAVLEAH